MARRVGTNLLQPYAYEKLSQPNALRILKLHGASSFGDDLHCDLVESQLSSPGSFEAVSWCWGKEDFSRILRVHVEGEQFSFPISPNLESALRALRNETLERSLWVDAICIDQKNMNERNSQVPNMDQVYGKAENVCIWLGDSDDSSQVALKFIKDEVLKIWEFDKLCENLKKSKQWHALVMLMKRPWFSRRWVVQEVALGSRGTIHCGTDTLDWQQFADAVSLFVEVESATHRLSEVMKRDQTFDHIPDFFGHVPQLGAALLVDATSNLFRSSKNGERKPLSNLEYLVSRLSVFEASQPRDTIYALLAIAKDTTPKAEDQDLPLTHSEEVQRKLSALGRRNMASETYRVDYSLPVVSVYKDFIFFSIRKSDQSRALDIICRPWAPRVERRHDKAGFEFSGTTVSKHNAPTAQEEDLDHEVSLPSWIPDLRRAAFTMKEHPNTTIGLRMERKNADPLVGLPTNGERNYSAAGTRVITRPKLNFKKREHYYSMFVEGFILDKVDWLEEPARLGNIPWSWLGFGGWRDSRTDPPQAFWRTLVADRGANGRNPPTFYPRACKESINKMTEGEPLDTKKLIDEGRCTIVAEFLRRVQAVVWNRRLMHTERGHMGLVHETVKRGDVICVLYGCSVPVVLRKVDKSEQDINQERIEDEHEMKERLRKVVKMMKAILQKRRERRLAIQNTLKLQGLNVNIWRNIKTVWPLLILSVGLSFLFWHHTTSEAVLIGEMLVCISQQLIWSDRTSIPPEDDTIRTQQTNNLRKYMEYTKIIPLLLVASQVRLRTSLALDDLYPVLITFVIGLIIAFPQLRLLARFRSIATSRWHQLRNRMSTAGYPIRVEEPAQYYWKLIGECYVHGMMNGEAIALQNEEIATENEEMAMGRVQRDNIKARTFELR
ncbi:hypothetical protein MMC18_007457 [Xylographa bjoerkii]|nr:hypothetical protein [Xylographa bjoerkii]